MGWIGVDLDSTLAYYEKWEGPEFIGEPVPVMMDRVKEWIGRGIEVKIFTARAGDESQVPFVQKWLDKHGIGHLEITNVKDFRMWELWDDRCVHVEKNTGMILG